VSFRILKLKSQRDAEEKNAEVAVEFAKSFHLSFFSANASSANSVI
jgi:hypothetical protein